MAWVLEGAGVAALHVDTGRYEECLQAIVTIYPKPGHKLDVQHAIKEAANVLVIGGSPADVAAAITARRRGYYVELWEKEDRQGDNLWAAGGPVFKTDILKLIRYQVLQGNKLGVKLCLNRSADEHNVCGGIWDKVIPAAGASPALPPIKGVEDAAPAVDNLTYRVTGPALARALSSPVMGWRAPRRRATSQLRRRASPFLRCCQISSLRWRGVPTAASTCARWPGIATFT